MQFEDLLQPLLGLLWQAVPPAAVSSGEVTPRLSVEPAAGAQTASRSAAAAAAGPGRSSQQLLSVQLLLDPLLCPLPWEALPVFSNSTCNSIARCMSLSQLVQLLSTSPGNTPGNSTSPGTASAAPTSAAQVLDLNKMTYLADPLYELSEATAVTPPGWYSPPLLPMFK